MNDPTFNLPGPIVLTGFMAAGKTTLAREIARALNAVALDLDAWIVQQQGCSIAAFINSHGEEEFRRIETGEGLRLALAQCIPGALEGRVAVLAAERVNLDLYVPTAHRDD